MANLIQAVRNNDVARVKLLLQHGDSSVTCWSAISSCFGTGGIDVNCRDYDGKTVLIIACEMGNTEVAKLLLRCKDVDVNHRTPNGDTALTMACDKGHIDIVRMLVDRGDLNISDEIGLQIQIALAEESQARVALDNIRAGRDGSLIDILEPHNIK